MTEAARPHEEDPATARVTPSRRDRLKPLELLGFSAVLAIFAGLVVLMALRSIIIAVVVTGIAFIVTIVMVALLGLGKDPSAEDIAAREDLQKPGPHWH